MRLRRPLYAVCLSFVPWAMMLAAPPAPTPPRSAAPPPTAPAAAVPMPDPDAARHARRTACLKEARDKKLLGAGRDEYVKDCVGKP